MRESRRDLFVGVARKRSEQVAAPTDQTDQQRGLLYRLPRRDLFRLVGAGLVAEACGFFAPDKIETATRIYRDANQRGEFAFALPQVVLDEKGIIKGFKYGESYVSHVEFTLPHTKGEKEIIFPAPVEGVVQPFGAVNPDWDGEMEIVYGRQAWYIGVGYTKNKKLSLVNFGQHVSIGDPLYRINLEEYEYGPNVIKPSPDGVVIRIWVSVDAAGGIQEITEDNIIKDPRDPKKYLSIPTVRK